MRPNAIFISFIALAACSSKDVYDAVQENRRTECQKLPDREQQQCLQDHQMSYEAYKRLREESSE